MPAKDDEFCQCGHWRGYHCGVGKYEGNCVVVGCECKTYEEQEDKHEA